MTKSLLQKNPRVVSLSIIVIGLIVVAIPVKNTIQASVQYFAFNKDIRSSQATHYAKDRTVEAEKLLAVEDNTKIIFEAIGNACQANHVLVEQVELPKEEHNLSVITQYQQVSVRGDFINILKSLNDATAKLETVKVASINFEREERDKKIALIAHVIFQSVKLSEEDAKK